MYLLLRGLSLWILILKLLADLSLEENILNTDVIFMPLGVTNELNNL